MELYRTPGAECEPAPGGSPASAAEPAQHHVDQVDVEAELHREPDHRTDEDQAGDADHGADRQALPADPVGPAEHVPLGELEQMPGPDELHRPDGQAEDDDGPPGDGERE